MRTRSRIAALAAVAVAAAAGPATATASPRLDSFSGSCKLRGTAAFTPPATNRQQTLDVRYTGPGTCTGTLNGRSVSNAPVRVAAAARADGSCVRAKTLAPGSFLMEFADGTEIRGSYEFDFVGTDGSVTVRGRRSGAASGHGTFVNDRTPPDIAVQCASGGARSAPLDVSLTTGPPLVSERRPARRLRTSVLPRVAVVGRSTRFAFRVRRSGGAPVAGATVELAGRRARTGPRGRASIVAALPRRGTWVARASKPGFRAARAEVTARPPGPLTLEGECDLTGTVAFDPPLTTETRPVALRVRARGTCSGTLVDRAGRTHELDGAPAAYVAGAPAQDQSCNSGTPKGSGAIVLRWGRLRFTSSETRVGAAPILQLRGARGGSALLTGAANDPPLTLLQKCGGEGIDVAHLTGHLSTTPTISG
jgi:hypothetical protein